MTRLVIFAVAGAALAAALYVLLAGGGSEEQSAPAPEAPAKETAAPAADRPALPAESGEAESASGNRRAASPSASGDYVEYIGESGNRVRDHRGRDVPVDPDKPVRRPFKSLDIEAKVVARMGTELRGVARRCKSQHAAEVVAGSRIQPRVTFEIREGRLAVTAAEMAVHNLPEGGSLAGCVYSGAIGLTVEAPGHREVERHTMTVPIDLDRV
jgi:hypothetical protein